MHRSSPFRFRVLVLVGLSGLIPPQARGDDPAAAATEILRAAGIQGGLVVHLGCGDGRLTTSLGAREGVLIHGLDPDADEVRRARERIREAGLCGKVTVERWSADSLPYIDNLVSLLVSGESSRVPEDEILRVLRPGGVALLGAGKARRKLTKPRPAALDEWTHFLHDASGNAVSSDAVSGPPRHMQWVAAPRWSRNHHKLASVSSVVTAGGRIFYILDEATAGSMQVPGRWTLIARGAFSGVLLWKQPIATWAYENHGFRAGPVQLPRLLVTDGERVYSPLGMGAPVSALDAATGKVLATYEETRGAEEIVLHDEILLVVKGAPSAEQAGVHPERRGKNPFPNTKKVVALRTGTGRKLWTWSDSEDSPLMPLTLAAEGRRVLLQTGDGVLCLALKDGTPLWSTGAATGEKPGDATAQETGKSARRKRNADRRPGWSTATLVVHEDTVLHACGGKLKALSLDDGRSLWECPSSAGFRSPVDVLVAGGLVWVSPDYTAGRDPRTGEVKRRLLSLGDLRTLGHHHRCYREKATDRYLLGGYRGIEFFDIEGDDHSRNNWVRGTCQYGVLPANGLVYAPPHACGCYMEAKLFGFWALAPGKGPQKEAGEDPEPKARLEKGPAFAKELAAPSSSPDAWPTYRQNPLRSGSTSSAPPGNLRPAWKAEVGGRLTQPVAARGTVLVASVDEDRVVALSASDGSRRWSFTAGGRVDSPPTIHGNRVLFGSADGHVTCLRLDDGALVWRFRAATRDLRTVAYDHLESVWPVHGSVLVLDGVAYATAGRSSYIDGGIRLWALDPATGEVLHEALIESEHPEAAEGREGPGEMTRKLTQNATDPKTFQAPDLSDAFSMAGGTTTDVLVSDGDSIFLRTLRFDRECVRQENGARHLFSTSGLLDGSENHRSHWMVGLGDFSRIPVAYSWIANRLGGAYGSVVAVPYGLLLAFDEDTVWGVRRVKGYTLFAEPKEPFTGNDAQMADVRAKPEDWQSPWKWSRSIDLRPRALVQAGDMLLLAGTSTIPGGTADAESFAAFEGRAGGTLRILSARDGSPLSARDLEAPPVWDGLAVAGDRVYLSRTDGVVECLDGD